MSRRDEKAAAAEAIQAQATEERIAEDEVQRDEARRQREERMIEAGKRFSDSYRAHSKVRIIVDSCGDFAPAVAKALGVEMFYFPYVLDGVEHVDDLWKSITPKEFYDQLRAGADFHTSAIPPGRYEEVFEQAAQEGKPTLYLGFTGGLSSSIYAAEQGAQMVRERHPDFELYVLDNLCPSAAAELLAIEAVRQAGNGMTAQELYAWASDARYFIQGYFTLESFDALAKGGRIPPAAAQVGGTLDIKPELSYDLNGSLTLRSMCRGRKKALRAIVNEFREHYAHDHSLPLGIMTADAEKDGDWLEGAIRKEPGCEDLPIIRSSISPVIGGHVGPGMVALVFWGDDRREQLSLTDRIARRVKGGRD
jgi:DegV family protein with EDD domain